MTKPKITHSFRKEFSDRMQRNEAYSNVLTNLRERGVFLISGKMGDSLPDFKDYAVDVQSITRFDDRYELYAHVYCKKPVMQQEINPAIIEALSLEGLVSFA